MQLCVAGKILIMSLFYIFILVFLRDAFVAFLAHFSQEARGMDLL